MDGATFFKFVDNTINDRVVGNEGEKITKIKAVIEYIKSEKLAETTDKAPQ